MSDSDNKRLADKLDKLDERLDEMSGILLRNTISLEEHIKRTNLLESRLAPIERSVDRMNAIAWFLTKAGAVALALLGALKSLNVL
jgi:hypothetical protein